jgi:hypothetical protein
VAYVAEQGKSDTHVAEQPRSHAYSRSSTGLARQQNTTRCLHPPCCVQAYVWHERDRSKAIPWVRLGAALLLSTVTDALMRAARAAAHLVLLSYRIPVKRKVRIWGRWAPERSSFCCSLSPVVTAASVTDEQYCTKQMYPEAALHSPVQYDGWPECQQMHE